MVQQVHILDVNCHSCEKNWTHMSSASLSYSRLVDKIRVEVEIFKIRICTMYVCLISVQCYCSVRNAFQSAFLKYNLLKVCFEGHQIWIPTNEY